MFTDRHHELSQNKTSVALRLNLSSFWVMLVWLAAALSLATVATLPTWAQPAGNALPTGGVVTAGSGNVSQSGNQLTVNQSTNKLSLNWQTFDIGQNAGVTFVQPNSQAIALNTVLSANPSQIYGRLRACSRSFQ